jgi:hypothetical protein
MRLGELWTYREEQRLEPIGLETRSLGRPASSRHYLGSWLYNIYMYTYIYTKGKGEFKERRKRDSKRKNKIAKISKTMY